MGNSLQSSAVAVGSQQEEVSCRVGDKPLLPHVEVDTGVFPRFVEAVPVQQVGFVEDIAGVA